LYKQVYKPVDSRYVNVKMSLESTIHVGGEKSGGGRIYLKKDWLWLLDINPKIRKNVEVEITVDGDRRELIIKKKSTHKTA
jgi:hypothetical protein